MPPNNFVRLSGAYWNGLQRSVSGKDVGHCQMEVLAFQGNSLLGHSRMSHSLPSESFASPSVSLQPRMVAAGPANIHTVNRRKKLLTFGAASDETSFPSSSGPSFQVCGYHVDSLLSEPSQETLEVNTRNIFMAVCRSRVPVADCSMNKLISRHGLSSIAAYHYSSSCIKRSEYYKATVNFKRKEQPNKLLLYGYLMHKCLKPHLRFCFEGCQISACFPSHLVSDSSVDNSVCQERHSNSADSSKPEIPSGYGRALILNSGSCYLPHPDKKETGGEDAYFICMDEQAIGVADGVGGWADLGVDAGQYARELMSNSVDAIQEEPSGSVDPARVLEKAYLRTNSRGSSTACIIALNNEDLHAINLGDSGFMVIRDGSTIFRSPVQQHYFNFTYQLESGNRGDLPSSGQVFTISVAPGDIIIAGTDGLFDNLYNTDITSVVIQAVRTGSGPQFAAQKIAELARQRAQDKNRQTPFSTAAQEAGFRYNGGKLDDTTVVVSYITSNNKV